MPLSKIFLKYFLACADSEHRTSNYDWQSSVNQVVLPCVIPQEVFVLQMMVWCGFLHSPILSLLRVSSFLRVTSSKFSYPLSAQLSGLFVIWLKPFFYSFPILFLYPVWCPEWKSKGIAGRLLFPYVALHRLLVKSQSSPVVQWCIAICIIGGGFGTYARCCTEK